LRYRNAYAAEASTSSRLLGDRSYFRTVKLPNPDRAIVDVLKLTNYVLDPIHPRGKHKARVFNAAFGIVKQDAEWLRGLLLRAARDEDAVSISNDEFGDRYRIDFVAVGVDRDATIRSSWIVRRGETFARFVSCYILLK
jgi:hypothetical protein